MIRVLFRWLAVLTLGTAACHTQPSFVQVDATAEQLRQAAIAVLAEGGDVSQEGPELWTTWRDDPSVRELWKRPGNVLEVQSKYQVSIRDGEIAVDAQAKVLVYFGVRRRTWELLDAQRLEEQLLQRIFARISKP